MPTWQKVAAFTWGHASHEACELKLPVNLIVLAPTGHASHEACELKFEPSFAFFEVSTSHASHEACELKFRFLNPELNKTKSRLA